VLARRAQLSERSDSLVSFQTALVDVLSASGRFRLPVVLEYEELKSLERNAVTDPLTGLHNRRLFDETFDKELNRARRYAQPLSLVALDLHRFKEVNDKHGHPRGDDVLHAAAATLRKALRTSDSAFRTGGDEFALLLPQTDLAQASALSRRIGVVFSELLRPLNLSVSVSMDHGVATYPQDGDQRDHLIRLADERLYHFKHNSHAVAPEKAAGPPAPSSPGTREPAAAAVSLPEASEPETAAVPELETPAEPGTPAEAETPAAPEPPAPPETRATTMPAPAAAPARAVAGWRARVVELATRLHGVHLAFERGFERFRDVYRNALAWALSQPKVTVLAFLAIMLVSLPLFPLLGRDFFPEVDAGQMRLHVRAPPGTRLETTQQYFAAVEGAIRKIVGNGQIAVVLDNIGLPYSGINIALSDSATVGPMDGEILISLKEKHAPTAELTAQLRRELPQRFPALQFFFQPADIVDQVLNFGQPAPIDVRVSASDTGSAYGLAARLTHLVAGIPGIVDAHVAQVPDAPALSVNVDRTLATQVGLTQREAASNVLVTTSSSAQTSPNFWVDPKNGVSYPLVVQQPSYDIASSQDLNVVPVSGAQGSSQLLMNMTSIGRQTVPLNTSQLNIRPVFDVQANVQGRDLYSASRDIDRVIAANKPPAEKAMHVTLSGQVETMRDSYTGLFAGIALAVVLVYLFLVINFQSWIDPLIVLMATPFALSGVMWMLFLTQTHLSVPALMGTLMCIGLTTANSILVVTFANQRMAAGDDPLIAAVTAGFTRIRPVLMTAGAMILGMVPMAIGVGEGGEQNAPLARAVIGGLLFATFATLVFVPTMYRLLRRAPQPALEARHA